MHIHMVHEQLLTAYKYWYCTYWKYTDTAELLGDESHQPLI